MMNGFPLSVLFCKRERALAGPKNNLNKINKKRTKFFNVIG